MDIVGTGYLARHLRPIEGRHPHARILAAGVPGHHRGEDERQREFRLVERHIQHCRGSGQSLVFLSSTSMYGTAGRPGREDDEVIAGNAYGQHKLELEQLVRSARVNHLILRLTQVIGPDEPPARLIPVLVEQLAAGQVRLERDARRDLLHVDDFVTIIDGLLGSGVHNEVVNVASGDCVPVARIVDHLEQRLDLRAERVEAAAGLSYCSSVTKLRRLLPGISRLGFGPGYYRQAIDRYLAGRSAAQLA